MKDRVQHRTVLVRAPHSYLARAKATRDTGGLRQFATSVENRLEQLARGRSRLKKALEGARSCALSAQAAAVRVSAVVANRSAILDGLRRLPAPTGQARTIVARLQVAIRRSITADRDYRAWLNAAAHAHAGCPPPRTKALDAAGRADIRSTAAKQRFVAAFNALAQRERLRTWRADQF